MLSLAGCYCINANCGSNLVWNNISVVLKGSGMVSASSSRNLLPSPMSMFLKLKSNITARHPTRWEIPPASLNQGPNPEQYFHNGRGTLPGDQEALKQSRDPNSLYSQLNVLNNNIGSQYETMRCSIKCHR